jgi:hypothetical protein
MRHRLSSAALSCLLLTLACACSGGGSGGARRLFVTPGGHGSGSGGSWEDASADLQSAIDAARPGDEIWVASGTYTPAPPGAERTATFRLKTGVTIRGGFAGDESSLTQRAAGASATVLSGDLDGDDGPDFSGRADNCYHVVSAFGIDQSGTLDTVTIRGGHGDGPGKGASPESQDQGSGIDIFDASPRLLRCTFEDNWNDNHGAANDHGIASVFEECVFRANGTGLLGAGLYIHHHSETLVVDCRFEDNTSAGEGGGAYCRSHHGAIFQDCVFRRNHAVHGAGLYVAEEATPEVTGCTFEENDASTGGGGVYSDHAAPFVHACTFVRNLAGTTIEDGGGGGGGSGGGGFWDDGGTPLVENCHFEDNRASFGSGVYLIFFSQGTVRDCTFVDNHALEGGGLYTLNSDALVEDCTFTRNTGLGGSFSVGGGVSNYFSSATYRRCTFVGNRAELGGGGAYAEGESPRFFECAFVGNRAFNTTEGFGGGLLISFFCNTIVQNGSFIGNESNFGAGLYNLAFGEADIVNCTFVDNRAAQSAGRALDSNVLAITRVANVLSWRNAPAGFPPELSSVRYSCVEGGYAGDGNFSGDPLLAAEPAPGLDGLYGTADDSAGDVRLGAGSLCTDAGDNSALLAGAQLDLAGQPRFRDDPAAPDHGVPAPPIVDIGAYER